MAEIPTTAVNIATNEGDIVSFTLDNWENMLPSDQQSRS